MPDFLRISDEKYINLDHVDTYYIVNDQVIFDFASGRIAHCPLELAEHLFPKPEDPTPTTRKK